MHLAGDDAAESEEQLRARCEQAKVPYLAPGAHPEDSLRREVASTVEATRRMWRKKRRRLLNQRIERAGSKAPMFWPAASISCCPAPAVRCAPDLAARTALPLP